RAGVRGEPAAAPVLEPTTGPLVVPPPTNAPPETEDSRPSMPPPPPTPTPPPPEPAPSHAEGPAPARPGGFATMASTAVAPPAAPTPIALDDDEGAAIGPDDRRSGDDS
ncbi:MAG: hypothetical protein IT379_26315, partial [Deltaproteobacteria bacterium]|nr:hypothetical protein [Deltaproteobacteria bacterium]